MPHLANLMIPNVNGDHPLSAEPFGAAMVAYVTGNWTAAQARTYLESIMVSNGGTAFTPEAIAEIQQIVSNFNGGNQTAKMAYYMKITNYCRLCEDSAITAAEFDSWLGIV